METGLSFPQALSEKYQPAAIGDFIGLDEPKAVLSCFLRKPFRSSWLFLGPSGRGKTTMALAMCKAIGAELHSVPSRKCDLDTVDEICRICHYVPLGGGFHFILVDEADQMTQAAQLALLSKLDATDFPPQTIFVFTANDTSRLEPRFLSRCRTLRFSGDGIDEALPAYLKRISHAEGGNGRIDYRAVAKESGNNVRDALMKLEVELMKGDLAGPKAAESESEHSHRCPMCGERWNHDAADCVLAFSAKCKGCGGGALTVGQERARKAVETRKANLDKMIQAGKGRVKRGK